MRDVVGDTVEEAGTAVDTSQEPLSRVGDRDRDSRHGPVGRGPTVRNSMGDGR